MFKCRFSRKCDGNIYLKMFFNWANLDDPYAILTKWPLLRFIRGHMRSNSFFASNFWFNRDRALGMVPIYFLGKDASNDIHCHLPGSTCDLTWPWPEVKFWHWPFKVNMYIFRRVSTRGIWCYVPHFLSSKRIWEKRYFDLPLLL